MPIVMKMMMITKKLLIMMMIKLSTMLAVSNSDHDYINKQTKILTQTTKTSNSQHRSSVMRLLAVTYISEMP